MKMKRLVAAKEILREGDYIKLRGNIKASKVGRLVGYSLQEIVPFCSDELEGFYRPIEQEKGIPDGIV